MCLAIPGEVLEVSGDEVFQRNARIAFAGIEKEASLALLPDAQVGQYVLVHAGFAIAVVNEVSARRTLDDLDVIVRLDHHDTRGGDVIAREEVGREKVEREKVERDESGGVESCAEQTSRAAES